MTRRTFPLAKGSTTARGYGARHQAERRAWDRLVQTGTVPCVRCGHLIEPGSHWHLDHDDDKRHYRGPAHASCNLRAAARKGNLATRALWGRGETPRGSGDLLLDDNGARLGPPASG
jgi:hypothetical protein